MNDRGWLPDEKGSAGVEHFDRRYVAGYDRKSATDPSSDITRLQSFGLDRSATVLDIGAGTGTFSLAISPFVERVIAVDVSDVMLDRLRERSIGAGLTNVETVQAGFLTYEHTGEPVDCIYSRNALHHLPDFWKAVALKRLAAMLGHGGVFMLRDLVYSFELEATEDTVEAWLEAASADPLEGWTRSELETHLREEFSTFAWLLEPMLQRAGFSIEHAEHRNGIYATYTCIRL